MPPAAAAFFVENVALRQVHPARSQSTTGGPIMPVAHYGGIRGLDPLGVEPLLEFATRFEGRNLGETVV